MNDVEQAKLLAALLGVLQKQNTKLKKQLTEELLKELDSQVAESIVEGPKGEQGERGFRGETGPKGERGFIGERGPEGEIGPRGFPGSRGERGIQGEQGIPGLIGEQGPVGPKGEQGEIGPQGLIGPRGEKGIQGEIGHVGPRGLKGDKGARGEKGDTGEKGDRGEVGLKGDKGDPGEQGPTGLQGLQGEKGDRGPEGKQGPKGPKGDKGDVPDIKPIVDDVEKFKAQIRQKLSAAAGGGSFAGSGEVRLEFLDDVDRDSAKVNGKFLKYNSATGMWVGATGTGGGADLASSTSDDLSEGANNLYFTTERARQSLSGANGVSFNTSTGVIQLNSSFNSKVCEFLGALSCNVVPATTNTVSLGTSDKRFKDIFLSGSTIDIDGALIQHQTVDMDGVLLDGVGLPFGSSIRVGSNNVPISVVSKNNVTGLQVPFFTKAGGLTNPSTSFTFQSNPNRTVFIDFTLSNGTGLTDPDIRLFTF